MEISCICLVKIMGLPTHMFTACHTVRKQTCKFYLIQITHFSQSLRQFQRIFLNVITVGLLFSYGGNYEYFQKFGVRKISYYFGAIPLNLAVKSILMVKLL